MDQRRSEGLRTLLIVLIGQVGCVTLGVIVVSAALGLWLDGIFHTRPIITLLLLFAGVPLSVILMLFLARRILAKMQAQEQRQQGKTP
jgi:F0F1-type ATP synthase assembly protein I